MDIQFTVSREAPQSGAIVFLVVPPPKREVHPDSEGARVRNLKTSQPAAAVKNLVGRLSALAPAPHLAAARAFLAEQLAPEHAPREHLSLVTADQRSGGGNLVHGVLWAPTESTAFDYYKLGALVYEKAAASRLEEVRVFLGAAGTNEAEYVSALLEGYLLASYRFLAYKKVPSDPPRPTKLIIHAEKKLPKVSLTRAEALVVATDRARDLIHYGPSDCSPLFFVAEAKKLASEVGLGVEVVQESELRRLGAGGILGVGQASAVRPCLLKLFHRPKGASASKGNKAQFQQGPPTVALVGKGVCFDSGGLSLKPAESMEGMKMDMAGGAAVLGAMMAIAKLQLPIAVNAYIPLVENMVSGNAIKPGDVLRMLSGKTVEVLNTDAEGRLILADALALAERDGAETIIDVATLTGACIVGLGEDYAGLFSSDERLAGLLQKAGAASGEHLWRLPLAPEYQDKLKSKIADLKNIGDRWGGAITAALFLQNFVTVKSWAHLDIAGPALARRIHGIASDGGAGFGVRTLVRALENMQPRRRSLPKASGKARSAPRSRRLPTSRSQAARKRSAVR